MPEPFMQPKRGVIHESIPGVKTPLSVEVKTLEEKPASSPLEKFDDPNEITDAEVTRQFLSLANHGTIPSFCTKAVVCAGCGPVWEREYVDPKPEACCWCYRRAKGLPIPRPGVACHPPALPGVEIPELLAVDARGEA